MAGRGQLEHPAVDVDHAIQRIVADAAAAQRVHAEHGPERLAGEVLQLRGQQLPDRVGPPARAHPLDPRLDLCMGVPQRRRQARLWPVHAQRAGLLAPLVPAGALRPRQLQHAVGVVVADQAQHQAAAAGLLVDRQRVGAARRLAAVAAAVGLGQAVQQVQGGGQLVVQAAQRAGHRELLHPEGPALLRPELDGAADGRPDRLGWRARIVVLVGARIGRFGQVHRKTQAVAVAAEAHAQARREGQAVAARAQQDLGRAEAAGGQHHLARQQLQGRAAACLLRRVGVHQLQAPAAPRTLQAQQAGAADHAHPARTRLAQQVEVERVLGADVATAQAVAAVRAGLQHHAGGVRPGLLGNAERHQGRGPGVQALQGLHLGQGRSIHALHAQAPRHFDQAAGVDLLEPRLQRPRREILGIGRQQHAGVDQRAAAQPVGQQQVAVGADAQVVQALGLAAHAAVALRAQAQFAGQFGQALGKGAVAPLAAALQQQDVERPALVTQLRQLGRRHRPAVAAADDHQVPDQWPTGVAQQAVQVLGERGGHGSSGCGC
jgi:hypothetical protein